MLLWMADILIPTVMATGFRKGGVGSYHMEAEYPTNPEYKNLRKAIQIMNPSTKPLIKY